MEAEANAYRAKAERRIDELSASLQRERVELAVAQGALETTRRDYMRLQRDILAGRSPQQTGPNLEVVSDTTKEPHKTKNGKGAGGGKAPAILFDSVPGYPKGFRTLYGQLSSVRRIALTLGLPLEYERKVDVVRTYHARMQNLKPLPPRFVNDGPVLENVIEGDDVDVLRFPVPRHHELDKARFIGTADCVMTQDPDSGWFNLGAYRSQVYDGKTVGCQITEGKHGRIHRDKYFERGQPMKVVILCGQDPLLFMLASSPLPEVGEMDIAGGLRGEPVDVVRGPYTGFPIPADCEIAIEGETMPGQVRPEGPFGEWMGYYSDDTQERPFVNVKTILYRNDPILTCAPQHKPVDETGLLKGIAGAAQIWRALEACRVTEA